MRQATTLKRMGIPYEYACVGVCGAAVLGLEILGTRVLAPFYGAGLYLWTALIVVTLGALATGYVVGGSWADRHPRRQRLALLPCGAGLWMVMIPLLRRPVLKLAEPMGLRAAVLVAALLLFFIPLAFLGMVSPYAVRLKARGLDRVGRTAGRIFALSTLAGVIMALAVGFYLLPWVGVTRLVVGIGASLLGVGIMGIMGGRGRGALIAGSSAVSLVVAGLMLTSRQRPAHLLFLEQSPYGEIRVVDYLDARFLLIDGSVHTMVDAASMETLYPYAHVMDLARRFFPEPGRMLLIGLGGGSLAGMYARHGWEVDAVEIDPVVIRAAQSFFGLLPDEARVVCGDGRRFLLETPDSYQIIAFDAFGSSAIPPHLASAEVFELAANRLSQDGIVMVNVEAVGWDHPLVRAMAASLRRRFPKILALPTMEPPTALGNVVLMASRRTLDLPEGLPAPDSRFSNAYHRVHAWDNRFIPRGGVVLTDDRNPSDLMAEQVNLHARRYLHQYFGAAGASW